MLITQKLSGGESYLSGNGVMASVTSWDFRIDLKNGRIYRRVENLRVEKVCMEKVHNYSKAQSMFGEMGEKIGDRHLSVLRSGGYISGIEQATAHRPMRPAWVAGSLLHRIWQFTGCWTQEWQAHTEDDKVMWPREDRDRRAESSFIKSWQQQEQYRRDLVNNTDSTITKWPAAACFGCWGGSKDKLELSQRVPARINDTETPYQPNAQQPPPWRVGKTVREKKRSVLRGSRHLKIPSKLQPSGS